MIKKNIKYVIEGYEKQGSSLATELDLGIVSLYLLQRIFDICSDNPMYDCYKINQKQAEALAVFLKEPLELDKYDYFLTAYSL